MPTLPIGSPARPPDNGKDDRHAVTEPSKGERQRARHIGEAAGLRERRRFRRDDETGPARGGHLGTLWRLERATRGEDAEPVSLAQLNRVQSPRAGSNASAATRIAQ
jgi:hypothetical protein